MYCNIFQQEKQVWEHPWMWLLKTNVDRKKLKRIGINSILLLKVRHFYIERMSICISVLLLRVAIELPGNLLESNNFKKEINCI